MPTELRRLEAHIKDKICKKNKKRRLRIGDIKLYLMSNPAVLDLLGLGFDYVHCIMDGFAKDNGLEGGINDGKMRILVV